MHNKSRNNAAKSSTTIKPLKKAEKNIFKADRIIGERLSKVKGRLVSEFLIKWVGFSKKQSTWEPQKNLISKSLLADWRAHHPVKRGKKIKMNTFLESRMMQFNTDQQQTTVTKKEDFTDTLDSLSVSDGLGFMPQEPSSTNDEEVVYLGSFFSKSSKPVGDSQVEVITIEDDD